VLPLAVVSYRHDSDTPEIGEVTRDFGLAFAEDLAEIADTYLAIPEKVQKPKPGLVRESTEEFRRFGRDDTLCGSRFHICVSIYEIEPSRSNR
jgi:hypothetical protein